MKIAVMKKLWYAILLSETALYIAEFIHPISITAADTEVCLGSPLTINIEGIGGTSSNLSYSWNGPNGFTSSNQNPMISSQATNAMAGTYMVTVSNTAGFGDVCSTTKSIEVIVNDCLTDRSFSLSDPCSCDNPSNVTLGDGTFLFEDKIRIDASMYPAGTIPSVTVIDGNLLTATGSPYTLTTATAAITNVGGGIYQLPFYTKINVPSTLTVTVDGDSQIFTTDSCMPCPDPIPTMNQWGLLIFGLLLVNLCIFFIYQLDGKVERFNQR